MLVPIGACSVYATCWTSAAVSLIVAVKSTVTPLDRIATRSDRQPTRSARAEGTSTVPASRAAHRSAPPRRPRCRPYAAPAPRSFASPVLLRVPCAPLLSMLPQGAPGPPCRRAPARGCTPKPQKIPSRQIEPGHDGLLAAVCWRPGKLSLFQPIIGKIGGRPRGSQVGSTHRTAMCRPSKSGKFRCARQTPVISSWQQPTSSVSAARDQPADAPPGGDCLMGCCQA